MQNHWGIYVIILVAATLIVAGVMVMLAMRELQAETRRMRDLWGSDAEEKLTTVMAHRKRIIEARGETADQIIDRLVERQTQQVTSRATPVSDTAAFVMASTLSDSVPSNRCSSSSSSYDSGSSYNSSSGSCSSSSCD